MKTILSIDGGGMRGIIPAVVLSHIEKYTGKRTCEMFDLIAGTSTGGLLALLLACPDQNGQSAYTANDSIRLYENEGSTIFDLPLWKKTQSLGGLLDERYPSAGIESVLESYLGDVRLSQSLTEVLVTSYDIERQNPFYFKSVKAKRDPENDFLMKEAGRATSAAPTYFEPYKLSTPNGNYMALVDGGLIANNPSVCALVEAIKMWPGEDYFVISLGTGRLVIDVNYNQARDWGFIPWAKNILPFVFDAQSDSADHQIEQLMPINGHGRQYYRFQVTLTPETSSMDDSSRGTLRKMRLLAEDMIDVEHFELRNVCKVLSTRS